MPRRIGTLRTAQRLWLIRATSPTAITMPVRPTRRFPVMTISSRKLVSLTLAGLGAVLLLGTAQPASAQMAPVVDSPRALEILARYNEASQAEISCQRPLSIDEQARIAGMAAAASHDEFLAGS